MADSKLTGLSETSVPAQADVLYTVDVSDTTDDAAGSARKITIQRLHGLLNGVCQGRLTLATGVPVPSADQTAKTDVFFTPFNGNAITIYDGTRWKFYAFSQLTLALGTLTADKNYDVFIYDNAGTLTLELSAAWTNDTTRADALTTQDGVLVKNGATTRRYLGTIRTTSTTETEDSVLKRFVYNAYNRVRRPMRVTEGANDWAYATNTWRQANGNTANKVEFVNGINGMNVEAAVVGHCFNKAASTRGMGIAVGVDSTSSPSGVIGMLTYTAAVDTVFMPTPASYAGAVDVGYHYLAWLEKGSDGSTSTFIGDNGGDGSQSGMTAVIEA